MNWLTENLGTIVVCTILLVAVILVIFKMISDKKKGKSSCGCNCGSCPMSNQCHSKKK